MSIKINPLKLHEKYMEKVEDDLRINHDIVFLDEDKGLNIDTEYLVLPRHLTDVSPRDLGEYLNAFTQQRIYQRTILARMELVMESAEQRYLRVSSPLYVKYSEGKMSERAKDRLIIQDDSVTADYSFYQEKVRQVNLIKASIENLDNAIFLLSREVTRRNGDFDSESRAENVKKM